MNIDISKIWPGWTITERLGHGGFGHVYKAICESTQAVAAVKVIPVTISDEDIADHKAMGKSDREILELLREDAEWYMNEIKVMQQLKGSANIVNIEDSLCVRRKAPLHLISSSGWSTSHPCTSIWLKFHRLRKKKL